jgi:hypothetical protein
MNYLVFTKMGFDDIYLTSMNAYKREDDLADVCHINDSYFTHNMNTLHQPPKCVAVEVMEIAVPTFVPNPNKQLVDFMSKLNAPVGYN